MLTAWILSDPVEHLSTDWTAFDTAADRVFAGEDVYRPYDAETEPLPYLYPPFALWLALPLGLFGFAGSFFLSALFTACCLVFGLVWMSRAERAEVDRSTGLVVGLASGAAVSSMLQVRFWRFCGSNRILRSRCPLCSCGHDHGRRFEYSRSPQR